MIVDLFDKSKELEMQNDHLLKTLNAINILPSKFIYSVRP